MPKKKKVKLISKNINAAISLFFMVLAAIAVREQLRRPVEERTWQGTILGMPYDFRLPTPERLRNAFWNEESTQIFQPHVFGIGWSINFYPLLHPKQRI